MLQKNLIRNNRRAYFLFRNVKTTGMVTKVKRRERSVENTD